MTYNCNGQNLVNFVLTSLTVLHQKFRSNEAVNNGGSSAFNKDF